MGLRDMIRKKEDIDNSVTSPGTDSLGSLPSPPGLKADGSPEFRFVRSDTHTQEVIHPPSLGPPSHNDAFLAAHTEGGRSRSASVSSEVSNSPTSKARKRLSERLHLRRPRSSSAHVPQDLPDIVASGDDGNNEEQWEKRATMLASRTDMARSNPGTPTGEMSGLSIGEKGGRPGMGSRTQSTASGHFSSKEIDDDIQEAIRLHESGDLEKSTYLFGKLADPNGANNPLSQVLYGLALRHGWGCKPDVSKAVTYLTAAASNAAAVEQLALQAGLKKGGAAKGELVLAIFELGNSFRHGWGTEQDPVAAQKYYETAANLGDTDAMNETGWCYLEGFGCKKDKFTAARYYRLAETNGNKTLGNSWIWKEKYDPENADKKKKKWL